MVAITGFLILGYFLSQTFGLKQHSSVQVPPPVVVQQQIPPQRVCGCNELKKCHNDQMTRDRNLVTNCRQQCGEKIFLNPTLQKVVHCYDNYEIGRSDIDSRRQQCLENLGSRQCISDERHSSHQESITINTTEFLQEGAKRHNNHKISFPASVNSLNSCIKTCVKNQGLMQLNRDGTPVKVGKSNGNGEKNQHKNGKDYSLCATQLNCQLAPSDKKLDKQAKQLCKFQPGPHEDHDLKLCTCLEATLGQNLYCTEQLSPQGACTSTPPCSDSRQAGDRN